MGTRSYSQARSAARALDLVPGPDTADPTPILADFPTTSQLAPVAGPAC